jgi:signal transduction histidine kinase
VKDSGPGITSADIPLLFEKFVRLKRDLSSSIRGSGLGLYISKQLVEAMGGRIWVESSGIVGEGSRFYFTLPYVSRTDGGK